MSYCAQQFAHDITKRTGRIEVTHAPRMKGARTAGDTVLQSAIGSANGSSCVASVRHSSARMPIVNSSFHFPSCKVSFQASSDRVDHCSTPANSACASAPLA
jgi:hypothetical protein